MISLIFALALTSQASWPDAGDWGMVRADERCLTYLEYEGPGSTELNVSIELDGSSVVLINNSNWSAKDNARYPDMEIAVDEWVYSGPGGRGYISGGYRPGFTMNMPDTFLDKFASEKSLKVYNGDTLVDSLNLEGSAAAVASLRRCISAVKRQREAEERERRRWGHIPEDPFALAATAEASPDIPVAVQWARVPVVADFYPSRALERGIEGTATLSCVAEANGAPSSCAVVTETPSGAGFGAAAISAIRFGRLTPQTVDQLAGRPFSFTLRFDIAGAPQDAVSPVRP